MTSASDVASVRREAVMRLPADPSALNATIRARTRLTLLGWCGNQVSAVNVLYVLVRNALRHGVVPGDPDHAKRGITVRLRVTETHLLHIDVTDPTPEFPGFDRAVAGEYGRGLWGAKRLGAVVTWSRDPEHGGKTVRATMRPGPVDM
ncbi:ATP-binding protein [Streptomyces sp. NPDC092359]|uniref:ATP-binding protein n=1 Tax=Streptomyces sp. NPDC092359 TaxID=3366014 RepID=UPI00381F3894